MKKKGLQFLNPAAYDQVHHEIVVGCDLERMSKELEDLRKKHERQALEITEQRDKLFRHYQGTPPAAHLKQLRQLQLQLQSLNSENEAALAKLQASFFATLYHEAFHAYLDHWVYPSDQYSVPRWLNEGLAQLFENAFVEIGQLRVGRMDEKRLFEMQQEVKRNRFPTLHEILQAPPQQFFVQHDQEAFESARQYAAAWALAHFLSYDLKVLQTERLTRYVAKGVDQRNVKSFEELTGMPLAECEKRWHQYLLRLRTDGTLQP